MGTTTNGTAQILIDGDSYHGEDHLQFDAATLDQIMANHSKRGAAQLPIKMGGHEATDAAGYITGLVRVADGAKTRLMATISWSAQGAAKIKNGLLRYISPEIALRYIDKSTGEDQGPTLLGAALLNDPHIEDQPIAIALEAEGVAAIRLMAKTVQLQGVTMDARNELIKLLGLSADATDDQILEEINIRAANQGGDKATAEVAAAAALAAEAEKIELSTKLVEAEAVRVGLEARLAAAEAEKAKLAEELATAEALKLCDAAIAEGKMLPAQKQDYISLCALDINMARKIIDGLPVAIELGAATGIAGGGSPDENNGEYTAKWLSVYEAAKLAGSTLPDAARIADAKTKN